MIKGVKRNEPELERGGGGGGGSRDIVMKVVKRNDSA